MEVFQNFKDLFIDVWKEGISGVNISEILIITGKGIHSTSENNVYVSEELSKLRNTIPDFIKNNTELSSKIMSINEADKFSGGAGAIIIKLKVKV